MTSGMCNWGVGERDQVSHEGVFQKFISFADDQLKRLCFYCCSERVLLFPEFYQCGSEPFFTYGDRYQEYLVNDDE